MNVDEPSQVNPLGMSAQQLLAAANNGQMQVDPATGAATIKALQDVQDEVEKRLHSARDTARGTKLGGGYALKIDEFNRVWAVGGAGSGMNVLTQFSAELETMKEAVRVSMATYQRSDASNAMRLNEAGGGQ